MSKSTRNILDRIKKTDNTSQTIDNYEKIQKIIDWQENEKNKDEATKQHEHYIRKMKRSATPIEVDVKPAKKEKYMPGLQFEGNLRTLAEKYKTISEIYRHLSFGQLSKYSVLEENKIANIKTGKIAYDESTGEIFE